MRRWKLKLPRRKLNGLVRRIEYYQFYAGVAERLMHVICNLGIVGSIPTASFRDVTLGDEYALVID